MRSRVFYRGRLRFPYGFHTGDGRRLEATDRPLSRRPDGRVELAGTSLAGVLRADAARLAEAGGGPRCRRDPRCLCTICRLFGPEARAERTVGEGPTLRASRLHVSAGPAPAAAPTRIRDRVGIDRATRAAAHRRKYDLEVAEAGCEFEFELRIDDPEADEQALLEAVLRRLAGGWLFAGGGSASGLGRAELAALERHELDLDRRERLIEFLLDDDGRAGTAVHDLLADPGWRSAPAAPAGATEPDADDAAQGTEDPGWGQLRLALEIDFPWGLLVNDPAGAFLGGADHAFATAPDGSPLLPGSALRGALRSRAEQILRTLGGDRAACRINRAEESCHERIDRENRERRARGEEPPEDERPRHCAACRVFGSGRLASAVRFTDFLLVSEEDHQPVHHEFVAIDRFTGGAASRQKFDATAAGRATVGGEIHLEIGRHRLEEWGLGLLALTLRDLLHGDVPLGFGTAKGLNEYRARLVAVDGFWRRPPWLLAGLGLGDEPGERSWRAPGGGLADPAAAPALAGEAVAARLRDWVAALRRELEGPPG